MARRAAESGLRRRRHSGATGVAWTRFALGFLFLLRDELDSLLQLSFDAGSSAALLFTQNALLVASGATPAERALWNWVIQQGGTLDEHTAVRLRRETM